MKLKIDYNKITDSPYKKDTDSFFSFTEIEVEGFVNLVSRMNESSYYISGYRGVGKTSFIKKVEEELSKKNGFVFIHVSISKFDNYEIIIRNFIRQFYIQFIENESFKKFEDKDAKIEKLVEKLKTLNKQTFSKLNDEINSIERLEKTKFFGWELDIKELLMFFASAVAFGLSQFLDFPCDSFYKTTLKMVCLIWTLLQFSKLSYSITKTNTNTDENIHSEKSFYDDEIAEYRFNSLLKEFKELNSPILKPVFILDELDKLTVTEAKKVLYLFKSTLLSGNANFIVVGGQELYYELDSSNDMEDSILSTLFSKTYHVQLKSSSELRNLFDKLVLNKTIVETEDQKTAYSQYINGLIFESKKIPRKFVNLIKDKLIFEGDSAYLNISEDYVKPAYTELLMAFDEVCNNMKLHPEAIRDYIIMNLFLETTTLMNFETKEALTEYINQLE